MRPLCLALCILATTLTGFRAEEKNDDFSKARRFLEKHCQDCHGPTEQKNDLRFDDLSSDLSDRRTIETWQGIVDQLNRGEMPPKKRARPDAKEQAEVVSTLTAILQSAYADERSTGARTVIRRLNRIELRNTLRDLLYLDGPDFRGGVAKLIDNNGNGRTERTSNDPVRDFPADELEEGFDTIGQRLVMSDFLLKLIIGAAEECLDLATHFEPEPKVALRRFAGHIRTQGPNPGLERWSREIHPDYDVLFQRYREPGASTGASGRVAPDTLARKGVGAAGRYRITIEASAHHQKHAWGDLIASKQDEAMLLGLHQADARRGGLHEGNPTSSKLIEWPMPGDGSKHAYVYETWLDATWLTWIGWENAPYDRSLRASKLVEKYLPTLFRPKPAKDASKEEKQAYEPDMGKALLRAGYKGPHVRIHSMTVEPLRESWPPRSHVFLYGREDESSEKLILQFATRAFRSPVEAGEVAKYVKLVESMRSKGRSRPEALRTAYTAIIASPRFYYLQESEGKLSDYQIASRLSYLLWSSMPDEELFDLAAKGKLRDTKVVRSQVDRMLADVRAEAFTRRFTQRWLRLDKLGAMPPENGGPFRIYWDRQLESQMMKQTQAFFAHVLEENLPIRDFIDSDYTFLNERTATLLYDRKDVWGDGFRKVKTNDPRRGGIFTQPSVMTATANGVDTSPVVRGVWVLHNVLGTPPSPPPPDVEPLAPDLRGAKTIREQLELHRKVEACNGCHRKIDPLGFALENFDPIGRWRTKYPGTKRDIDPSATTAAGEAIEDIVGFKRMLVSREKLVVRCLAEKLLTYACGRMLEAQDRGEVDRILRELDAKGNRLRDLLDLVVSSKIFLTK